MIVRHAASSILVASALVAGCTVTSTTSSDGGTNEAGTVGTDAAATGDDASSDAGVAIDTGTTGDGGVTGCEFGEPNDTREQATPIELDRSYTGLCVSSPDGTDPADFYVITAPADTAGGFVGVTISNVAADGDAEFTVTAVADNGVVVNKYTTDNGATITGWFTVAPGAKYRVAVNRFGGAGTRFTYDLKLAYTKTVDAYEPNNTRADAKTLQLATPIQASAAASSPNAMLVDSDDADWYKITLQPGAATVTVSNAPSDFSCDVELFDPSNVSVDESYTTTHGANCQINATGLAGGVYTLNVHNFGAPPARAGEGTPTTTVTGSYTLTVSQ